MLHFVYPFVGWWAYGLFLPMAIRNNAAMNNLLAFFVQAFVFSFLGYWLEMMDPMRSLEGCSPWGRWGSYTTERLHFHFSLSCIGEGNGNPLQCSCLENPRNRGAWWAAVSGVAQSQTRLKRLSCMLALIVIFWDTAKFFSIVTVFHSHHQHKRIPIFPHPYQHSFFIFFYYCHRTGCKWYLIVVLGFFGLFFFFLVFISLKTDDVQDWWC